MGRNYYLFLHKDEDDDYVVKQLLQKLNSVKESLINDQLSDAKSDVYPIYDAILELFNKRHIHIGKSSADGFSFDHNNWICYKNREEMDEWLKSGQILGEGSDEKYSFTDFWKVVSVASERNKPYDGEIIKFGLSFSPYACFC